MLILRTPNGRTGPKFVNGLLVEATWRAHLVPLTEVCESSEHLAKVQEWMLSYRPGELFDDDGRLTPLLDSNRPVGPRRMSANPHADGRELMRELVLPLLEPHEVSLAGGRGVGARPTRILGRWLRDVVSSNPDSFRIFGPDETASNRLDAVYNVTANQWQAETVATDEHLAPGGQVIEVLNGILMGGLLEGHLLTRRHGLFNSYEAFIDVVDSMFNQYAKWLESSSEIPWCRSIASFTYLLFSLVWPQDYNGFSHQYPGFLDHVVNQRASVVRVYLPLDSNTLLVTVEHCLRSGNYVNVIVAGKQPAATRLGFEEARAHSARGISIWDRAGTEVAGEDIVCACACDVPKITAVS